MMMAPLLDEDEDFQLLRIHDGVKTLQTQDTSDPRHFGTGAKLSGHIGTSVKVSWYFGTKEDTSSLGNTRPSHGKAGFWYNYVN